MQPSSCYNDNIRENTTLPPQRSPLPSEEAKGNSSLLGKIGSATKIVFDVLKLVWAKCLNWHALSRKEQEVVKKIGIELTKQNPVLTDEVKRCFEKIVADPIKTNKNYHQTETIYWKQVAVYKTEDEILISTLKKLGKLSQGLAELKKCPNRAELSRKIENIAKWSKKIEASNSDNAATLPREQMLTRREANIMNIAKDSFETYQAMKKHFGTALPLDKEFESHKEFYENCQYIVSKAFEKMDGGDNRTLAFYSETKFKESKNSKKTLLSKVEYFFRRGDYYHCSHLYRPKEQLAPKPVHICDKYRETDMRFSEMLNCDFATIETEKLVTESQKQRLRQMWGLSDTEEGNLELKARLDTALGNEVDFLISNKKFATVTNWSLGKGLAALNWFGLSKNKPLPDFSKGDESSSMICSEYVVILFAKAVNDMNEKLKKEYEATTGKKIGERELMISNPFAMLKAKCMLPVDTYHSIRHFTKEYSMGSSFLRSIVKQ